jgi:hypothetical protein
MGVGRWVVKAKKNEKKINTILNFLSITGAIISWKYLFRI